MQDLDINRISFEEIKEFHDLNMNALPDGQYSIVAVVTGGKDTYISSPIGSSGGTVTVPPLSSVVSVGNTSSTGIEIGGSSAFDILQFNRIHNNDITIENNSIESRGTLNISTMTGIITMSSTSEVTLNVARGIVAKTLNTSHGIISGGTISASNPVKPQELVTLDYLLNHYNSGNFLKIDGTSQMAGNFDLNNNRLILNPDLSIEGADDLGHAYIALNGEVRVAGKISAVESSSPGDLATVNYVNTAIAGSGAGHDPEALPKAGGTMEGDISMQDNSIAFGYDPSNTYAAKITGSTVAPGRGKIDITAPGGLDIHTEVKISNGLKVADKDVIVNDTTGGTGSITRIWTGTQAQYDLIVQNDDDEIYTLYVIV